MANQINGKILNISPIQNIPSKDGQRVYQKRELILDATRYDPYTGERQFESYPTFEFGGDKCAELDAFQPGQIVCVSFDLTGVKYVDKDNQTKFFNRVRGYKVELRQAKAPEQPHVQQAQQVQQSQQQQWSRPSYPQQGYFQQPRQGNYPPPGYPAPDEKMPF